MLKLYCGILFGIILPLSPIGSIIHECGHFLEASRHGIDATIITYNRTVVDVLTNGQIYAGLTMEMTVYAILFLLFLTIGVRFMKYFWLGAMTMAFFKAFPSKDFNELPYRMAKTKELADGLVVDVKVYWVVLWGIVVTVAWLYTLYNDKIPEVRKV